ncbi:MAG: hypothetical protein J3Q66DRAFT_210427 [Benniella sp.]|nr:MAG: hypothetical protein J3Q66DRAFT_210427 [Benniella sp.]
MCATSQGDPVHRGAALSERLVFFSCDGAGVGVTRCYCACFMQARRSTYLPVGFWRVLGGMLSSRSMALFIVSVFIHRLFIRGKHGYNNPGRQSETRDKTRCAKEEKRQAEKKCGLIAGVGATHGVPCKRTALDSHHHSRCKSSLDLARARAKRLQDPPSKQEQQIPSVHPQGCSQQCRSQ